MTLFRKTTFRIASVFPLVAVVWMGVVAPQPASADPNVDASKTGALTNDVDGDGLADPGDTITYTIIISNTGNMDANDVSFSDTIDPNTTLVGGSVKTTPLARDNSYNVTGNVGISVSALGVLGNDVDPDGGAVTAIAIVGGSSANLGDVDLAGDGSFTYSPPAGFTGNDSFTYSIQDADGNTDTATVNLIVTDMIWFVDNSNDPCNPACDGRLGSPFNDLTTTADSFDVNAADAAGDNIFVYAGTYNGGLTLLNSQKLIGDGSSSDLATVTGITLPTHSVALPVFSGTDPNVTGTNDGIGVGSGNTIRGLTLASGTGTGIRGTNVGTLSVSEASLSGGGAMDITTGNLAVNLDALSAGTSTDEGIRLASVTGTFRVTGTTGTIAVNNFAAVDITGTGGGIRVVATFAGVSSTNSATRGIRLANLTSGSNFNGGLADVTASSVDGLILSNNTGSIFTFADLDIDNFTTNQRGIFASTSGTLNISSGDIDGGSGRGVDIDGTDLNVTLTSVTSIGGSTAGIDLNTTTGTFTVTGSGTAGSGGTISNKTGLDGTNNGIGVLLNGAAGVSLSRMQLNDFTNFAIRGSNVAGFDLLNSVIDGVNGTSAGHDEGSVRFSNLTGSANFTNNTISGGLEDNLHVVNTSGTLNCLTVSGGTIGLNSTALGNDGVFAESQGSATLNITVEDVLFLGARGDLLQTNTVGNSTMDIVVVDNIFQNAHTNIVSAGGGITLSGGSGGGNITVTYDVSGTTPGDQMFRDANGNAITINYLNGAGSVSGTVENNNIGVTGVAGSGSASQSGMLISSGGSLTHTVTINNNDVRSIGGFAGLDLSANSSSTLNATITNNTVDEMSGFVLAGMYLLAGGGLSDTSTLCSDIRNNTVNAGGVAFASSMFFDQVSGSANHNLPQYSGSPHGEFGSPSTGTASVDIESYLLGRGNSLTAGGSAFFDVDASLVQGVTGTGTTCPLMAALGQGPGGVDSLSKEQLAAVVSRAIERWAAHGLSRAELIRLQQARIDVVDLPDGQLGSTSMMRISIDLDGAGYGWSRGTPAESRTPAAGKMDLLTVVLHEMGHVLGKSHAPAERNFDAPDLMAATLAIGVRRTPPVSVERKNPPAEGDLAPIKAKKRDEVDRQTKVELPAPVAVQVAKAVLATVLHGVPDADGSGAVAGAADVEVPIGTLPPGKSVTITFEVTVNGSLPQGTTDVCNQGVVSGGNFNDELTDDPGEVGVDNPTCNILDVATSDFAITKDDGQTTATPGGTVEYTIVVTNNGPDDATGATVSDAFPSALSGCTWTCTASTGSTCTAAGAGNISDTVDLLNGGTATYVATCDINASAAGTLGNTASVTAPANRLDPTPGNDSQTDIDTLVPEADLSITKVDSPDPVIAGGNVVYTITVTNNGPSDASDVSVSDSLPGSVVFVQTVGCAEDLSGGGIPTCTLGSIAAGGSVAYTVEVTTTDPTSIPTIVNSATASSATSEPNPDPTSNSASATTTVLSPNLPPTAAANGPYTVDEGGSVQLDGSGSTDPENGPLTYAWDFDNDGLYDDATGVSPTFSAAGLDGPNTVSVGLEVTDGGGLTDSTTADVDVANVAPSVSATPQSQDVQYSDRIVDVTVDATDVAVDTLSASTTFDVDGGGFVAGLPSGLSLTDDGCLVTSNTQTCTWTVSGLADVPAGVYTIRVTAQDDDGDSADVDITVNVAPEDATVTFDGGNPVALQVALSGGVSSAFVLAAEVMEFDDPFAVVDDDKLAGNISLAGVSMTLVPVGPGPSVSPNAACTGVISAGITDGESAHDYDILTVTCPFDAVPVNAYTLRVDVDVSGFYTGSGEDVLTVFDPSLGFTTGGGTFLWPGTDDRTNFGFNVKYGRKRSGAKGGLLLIRHLPDGTIFRLKSNKMSALAVGEVDGPPSFGWASFTGKATYIEPGWLSAVGNHQFVTYVEDHGTPGVDADRFWIEVLDRNGFVVPGLSMAESARDNAETIQGGNIVVPHKDRRGRR